LASGGGLFLANRALSPIDKITRAAQQISAEDFNRRIDLRGPDDEMRRLAYTFDDMIARLQSAFEQQRRFTADASHELRTPLTAMIGQIDVALDRPRDADSYRNTLAAVRAHAQRPAVSGTLRHPAQDERSRADRSGAAYSRDHGAGRTASASARPGATPDLRRNAADPWQRRRPD